jgi:hypothetical protein
MSKVELSINVAYLPGWGAWEGIRELVQNGRDAEVEFGAMLEVSHRNGTLRIENDGAEMDRNVLLFGTTSKHGRSDMIGKFGEGLKLGTLALVRQGHTVKIRTGDEVWTAGIARSERYDADVLVFDCVGGREPKRRVRVEIDNVSDEVWNELKERFLFIARPKKNEIVATDRGDLLLGERYRGRIFVKGIFVQRDPRLQYGYNFKHADVDRDRKMISSWDQEYESSRVWADAVAARPDLLDPYFELISKGDADLKGAEITASYVPSEVRAQVTEKFKAQFGADVVPVSNLGESHEVEHLGKRGVVVSKGLGAMLAETIGNKDVLMKAAREEVIKTLSWSDMNHDEQKSLFDAIALVSAVRAECKLGLIDIVEFRSPTLMGQYKDGRILIASRLLADRDETLATLVHEFSHREGGDGEKGHVMAIENLWRDIVKTLRGGKVS